MSSSEVTLYVHGQADLYCAKQKRFRQVQPRTVVITEGEFNRMISFTTEDGTKVRSNLMFVVEESADNR